MIGRSDSGDWRWFWWRRPPMVMVVSTEIEIEIGLGINWRDVSFAVESAASAIAPGSPASLFITIKDDCVARAQDMFIYWRQRCKVKWDAHGDSHSKLLFASVQARKRKNYSHSLQDSLGNTYSAGPQLCYLISDFYSDLFQVNNPSSVPLLSGTSDGSISAQDIRSTMFNIADDKSPGPDGFSAAFFKLHWSVVGGHVFRPIGLCNVIYKCIAKCLTHRMRSVLPSLISDTQNAFIPGRLMFDECMIAHELLSFLNRTRARKKFFFVVKLDMNKAYDHVLVNGELTRSFHPRCGLRQGDHLSPYLFVLCMEFFSTLLLRAEHALLLQGISVCRGTPSISHLFSAHDSLFFFRDSLDTCNQVLSILSEFSSLSGQIINYQKSFFKFSPNTPRDYLDYLVASLSLGQCPSFGPYLGVPVDIGRSKCSALFRLVDIVALFLIPKSICHRVDSLSLRFWWRASDTSRGMSLAPSSTIHLPKGRDGLSIRKIGTFNHALLAKSAWRIFHHPQLLLSRIYQDVWVSSDLVAFKLSINGLVCPTHVSSLLDSCSYTWNVDVVRRLFTNDISSQILALERSSSLMDDFMYWKFTPDGLFSVLSAYAMLLSNSHNVTSVASTPSSS
ncbi:uncharacterized protein [Spinacia oleracea]|uniref:Reverse transcriptase domain-containing protein n=1 Tax=Spinacia oleracea TaxID=3562 RepID=A0ABM3QQR6_SPIOL|nr:uncharacterized protein LOC130461574 [Spinacia oleracea]